MELPAPFPGGHLANLDDMVSCTESPHVSLDDSTLPQLDLSAWPFVQPCLERLHTSRAAVDLMNQALTLDREVCPVVPVKSCRSALKLSALKIELPLLGTDHDHDVQELLRACRIKRAPLLTGDTLPLERLDVEQDEALAFPASVATTRQALTSDTLWDKIDASREAMEFLAQSLECVSRETSALDVGAQPRKARTFATYIERRSMTPPLLSPVGSAELFIPDAEVCEVPLTSDPATLIEDDLRNVEKRLFNEDSPCQSDHAQVDIRVFVSSPVSTDLGTSKHSKSYDSVRVESPLLLHDNSSNTTEYGKTVQEYASEIARPQKPGIISSEFDDTCLPHEIFMEGVQQIVDKFRVGLQQERLDAADATARVHVPVVNFKIESPTWQYCAHDSRMHFRHVLREFQPSLKPPGLSRQVLSGMPLRWIPFSFELGRIVIKESIDELADVEAMLGDCPKVQIATSVDFSPYVTGSVNLLRRHVDEDEIISQQGQITVSRRRSIVGSELDRLLEEKIRSLPDGDGCRKAPSTHDKIADIGLGAQEHIPDHRRTHHIAESSKMDLLPDSTSESATGILLDNFMSMHAYKKRKLTSSTYFSNVAPQSPRMETENQKVRRAEVLENEVGFEMVTPASDSPAYFPLTSSPHPPARIIKSLAVDRIVFNKLEAKHPALSVIERDFSRWNSVSWNKGAITRSPKASRLATEADFIVSPQTGIIVTSLDGQWRERQFTSRSSRQCRTAV
ncbi:uncharacterized protein B0I36DRAFT_436707 [Microdochium trichocladiopsis]|uniref:DUF7102 domain-containing protein n=1 Tax=Microdochium trichocladiopsis TaxID=1682393 RepID=A0A9P9BLF7_9PEZI|nr:uncharacterized protein B0I36DRAFT_436707 [Microdochium trichocladiopsis]KAH7012744.1 hypothetical protein B0I36DRAFT_436707 [Microdochium trichocladiopsis]